MTDARVTVSRADLGHLVAMTHEQVRHLDADIQGRWSRLRLACDTAPAIGEPVTVAMATPGSRCSETGPHGRCPFDAALILTFPDGLTRESCYRDVGSILCLGLLPAISEPVAAIREPDPMVTIRICAECDDGQHDACGAGDCRCMCTTMDTPSCACGASHWSCDYDPNADDDEPVWRQTACKLCGLDIEGEVGGDEWRDRGGNAGDAFHRHAPDAESS